MSERRLMEGSEALAEACIAAGCRFFAGYPMTPFTELLEHMARRLPEEGGVCVNAESEIEAIGMAWGALATGVRAATGSTGQGLSLMQESLAEITLARLPLVVFNMARGGSDYFQATRGGGHGDYRHIVLAPMDINEGVELTQLAFHLADKWRNPVLVYGDYLLSHTYEAVDVSPLDFGDGRPAKDWAVDGRRDPRAKLVTMLGFNKHGEESPGMAQGMERHFQAAVEHTAAMERGEPALVDVGFCDDADVVVVAFGTLAKFVRYVVRQLRADGHRVGYVRPITLWPFPSEAVAAATKGARAVAVLENSGGQMIDDVRLAVLGRAPVEFIGGISTDSSGFGVGDLLDTEVVRARIEAVLASVVASEGAPA
ncbi:MAG TPA: thiamine pyrophosphate-binding protein [Acidimicrobiia bacterium]|nr:thiamine pyrophosphate-binding protein [Acidimicrobiia bacterium]